MNRVIQSLYNSSAFVFDKLPFVRLMFCGKGGLRIVYYHKVSEHEVPYYFNNDISAIVFDRQLDHLQRNFKLIPLTEALSMTREGHSLHGYACITFDDGFQECHSLVYPALRKRGIKATFFLIEDCIDNQTLMWRNKVLSVQNTLPKERIAALIAEFSTETEFNLHKDLMSLSWQWSMDEKESLAEQLWDAANMPHLSSFLNEHLPYLSDVQVREMIADGQEIGIHTRTHPVCARLTKQQVDDEIIECWRRLSIRFDTPIISFSYPFGSRCSTSMEQHVLANTDLQILLGIRDDNSNGPDASRWERRGMEMPYGRSITLFYLGPLRRKWSQKRATFRNAAETGSCKNERKNRSKGGSL